MCRICVMFLIWILPIEVFSQIPVDSITRGVSQQTFMSPILEKIDKDILHSLPNREISYHSVTAVNQLQLLKQDFGASILDSFAVVHACSFSAYDSNHQRLQLGVIEIGFLSDTLVDAAYRIIAATGRTNLKLKVLTKFKVIKKDNSLILFLSETPLHKEIIKFLDAMEDYL